ncbi:MAG: D-glycero-alpha-D-manno-heptose-1,7-bisphosphate 7-phosphatase, partial [Candidatus Entotheonellia bacterium]
LVVITNQSAVGRGWLEEERLALIHERLVELLALEGVKLDGIYVCPHTPHADCPCRKPRPALIARAAAELHFNPRESFVIGDKASDIELGRNVGAITFLVRTGYGAQMAMNPLLKPDYIVDDVWEAAQVIRRQLAGAPSRVPRESDRQ